MSRATELGAALGLDVEGSRRRHAAARVRYRAAISAALDRLCTETIGAHAPDDRLPVDYAAAGMTYPFERREIDGRGETQDVAGTTGNTGTTGRLAWSLEDPGPARDERRTVPVPVWVPARPGRGVG